jgi:hypothetical protein
LARHFSGCPCYSSWLWWQPYMRSCIKKPFWNDPCVKVIDDLRPCKHISWDLCNWCASLGDPERAEHIP